MGAILKRTDDDRTTLERLTRTELVYLARHEGRDDIDPAMPAQLMVRLFEAKPPARIPMPMRGLTGQQYRLVIPPYNRWKEIAFARTELPVPVEEDKIPQVDALDDLANQWRRNNIGETTAENLPASISNKNDPEFWEMPFYRLKKECAERGIPFKRTDGKQILLEKLNGPNPA